MYRAFKIFWAVFCIVNCLARSAALAQSTDPIAIKHDEMSAKSGSIYYSSNKKNEIVIRTNIWGAVQFPGVHYVPLGTHFLEAISIAGGPIDSADTSNISLSSKNTNADGKVQLTKISLTEALSQPDLNPILKPDDVILIKQDHIRENTQLWIGIGTFILTAAALGLLISQEHNR